MMMGASEVAAILVQTQFFNQQWKNHQDLSDASEFADLMRTSKNRCQLQLLKFFEPTVVWAKLDQRESERVGEPLWLVGGVDQADGLACHIPLRALQAYLTAEERAIWHIS